MKERMLRAGEMLDKLMDKTLERRRLMLSAAVGRLEAINPLAVIKRGYGVARDGEGHVLSSVDSVDVGERFSLVVSDGVIDAEVVDKRKGR